MPTARFCNPPARRAPDTGFWWGFVLVALLLLALGACAGRAPPVPQGVAAAVPREALPLDEAVLALAEATLAGARTLPEIAAGGRRALVIDPLIDRASGAETVATRRMVSRIEALVRERHPELELRPFTLASLDERPLILLGAITPVAAPGVIPAATGPSDTYRIWAVLGDLRTGTILSHPTAWVRGATVDATPVAFHRDSPVWTDDEMVAAYLRTCAGDPGTQMDPVYLRGLRAQAAVAEAVAAQERGEAERALALYREVADVPGGQQSRALNGVYLANLALGRQAAAAEAFGRLVDHGLARERLAMKLLFRPGGTEFLRDPAVSGPYAMWLRQIAERVEERGACLRVSGHASVTGSAEANDRISLARARLVRGRLVAEKPVLQSRSEAVGRGSREPIIGLGTDDMRDALDRRVEFRPLRCEAGFAGLGAAGRRG
jgi:outer membrane protein OmpA-like peptidoglycan-associated protein